MPTPADSCCCKIQGAPQICGPPISSAALGSGILFAIMSFIQGVVYIHFGRIILDIGVFGGLLTGTTGANNVSIFSSGGYSLRNVLETVRAGASCGVAAGVLFLLATVVTLVLMFLAHNAKSTSGDFDVTWAKRIWMGHTIVMILGYLLGLVFSIIHIGTLVIIMTVCNGTVLDLIGNTFEFNLL